MADYNSGSSRQNLTSTNDLILVDDFGPPIEQCAHFALARDGRFDGRLAEPDDAMRGDRKSTRLTPVTNAHLVCRLLLETKKTHTDALHPLTRQHTNTKVAARHLTSSEQTTLE